MLQESSALAEMVQRLVSRRALLGGAVMLGSAVVAGGAAVLGSADAVAAPASATGFLRLSEFLTGGKPLEAGLAARYQAALAQHDAQFGDSLAALQGYVAGAKAVDIDALLERPDLTDPLRKTITQIVSAWYLGIVGSDADAELIAYAEALMYRPTSDVLVIPSYGGGPDSWGEKPGQATPDTAAATAAAPTAEKQR